MTTAHDPERATARGERSRRGPSPCSVRCSMCCAMCYPAFARSRTRSVAVAQLREGDAILLLLRVPRDAIGARVEAGGAVALRRGHGDDLIDLGRVGRRLLGEDVGPRDHRLVEDGLS